MSYANAVRLARSGWTRFQVVTMLDDLRTAWRALRRAPLMTGAAITILALTIGANAAILGVADAVLLRPLPYAEPGRVFGVVVGVAVTVWMRALIERPRGRHLPSHEEPPDRIDRPGLARPPGRARTDVGHARPTPAGRTGGH